MLAMLPLATYRACASRGISPRTSLGVPPGASNPAPFVASEVYLILVIIYGCVNIVPSVNL